jgi:branched-chain amino acid aminotransferase
LRLTTHLSCFVDAYFRAGVELVTAPLTRGDILAGVTRDSILELTRGWNNNAGPGAGEIKNMSVSERWLTMGEVLEAHKEGRVSTLSASVVASAAA